MSYHDLGKIKSRGHNPENSNKREPTGLIIRLASKTVLRSGTTSRRTDAKRKSNIPVIESIPPRIVRAKQMPTSYSLPISLRIPRARHRRRRRERPTRRPSRLRHPHRLRVRNHGHARREITEARRRTAGVVWVHVRADPVDLVNQGLSVASLPNIGSVHVPERPTDPRGAHRAARLVDVGEDLARAGTRPGWVSVQIFAADGDPDHQAVELRVLLHGGRQSVEFIRHRRLPRGAPDSEQ